MLTEGWADSALAPALLPRWSLRVLPPISQNTLHHPSMQRCRGHTAGPPSMLTHGMNNYWAPFPSKATESASVINRKDYNDSPKGIFPKPSMYGLFLWAGKPNKRYIFLKLHHGSLCTGGAYDIISLNFQSCLHDFTSNIFLPTSA